MTFDSHMLYPLHTVIFDNSQVFGGVPCKAQLCNFSNWFFSPPFGVVPIWELWQFCYVRIEPPKTSERDRAFVALVILSWLCFWRVGESVSVRPFDLLEDGGVSFYRTKSGGPRGWHQRPLFRFGTAWASYLSGYCKRHDLPTDQPIFSGGEAVSEDYLTTLLHGSRWSGYAWHSLRRRSLMLEPKARAALFKWWGGWASTGVAMRYATTFLDHGVLASLALPCPGTGVEEPPVVSCLSLWGSATFGADAVEESLGYVGAVLGPALPHRGAVADEPHATVVGGGHGGPPGHESDSSSASSESSSSCESSDSDVRIIEPPAGKGARADPAFRIGTEERPTTQGHGGGGGGRATQTQAAGAPTDSLGQARLTQSSGSGCPQWS